MLQVILIRSRMRNLDRGRDSRAAGTREIIHGTSIVKAACVLGASKYHRRIMRGISAVRRPAPRRKARRKGKSGFVPAPPWAPLPRDIHKLWAFGLSGAVSYLGVLFSLVEAFMPRRANAPVDVGWLA